MPNRFNAAFLAFGSLAAAITVVSLGASAAQAQTVVFTNPGPNNQIAVLSDPTTGFATSQTFAFSTTQTFDTVDWFGIYNAPNSPPAADNFTISFYNTVGGVPATSAISGLTFQPGNAVSRTVSGGTTANDTNYSYMSTLGSNVTLTAGTYAISIVDNTTGTGSGDWAWDGSTTPYSTTDDVYINGNNLVNHDGLETVAFSLIHSASATTTPEPGVLVTGFSLLGMTSLGLIRGRRRIERSRAS